jgi:hypothetical protein
LGQPIVTTREASNAAALPADEILGRLALRNGKLVAQLFELARAQVQAEFARQGRIDAKATSLLAAVGFSLTVAAAFLGQLMLANSKNLALNPGTRDTIVIGSGVAIVTALAAAVCSILALRVHAGLVDINEHVLFDREVLKLADEESDSESGLAEYRKFLVAHLWDIVQTNCGVQLRKSRFILAGQACFLAFLGALAVVSGVLVWAAI